MPMDIKNLQKVKVLISWLPRKVIQQLRSEQELFIVLVPFTYKNEV